MELKRASFDLQLKDAKDEKNGDIVFSGKASVFGVVDSDRDIIAPGAFTDNLKKWRDKGRLPALLWQHSFREPIGKFTEISESEASLDVVGTLFASDIPRAKEAGRLIREKAIDGLSIGFLNSGPVVIDEEKQTRMITKADLWEISIVTFPALDVARIENVKSSVMPDFSSLAEIERFLREIGLSKKASLKLISQVKGLSDSAEGVSDVDFLTIKQSLDSLLLSINK